MRADTAVAGRVRPGHIGSASYTVDALPVVELHYGPDLQLSLDDGAKWTTSHAGGWAFGPVAEYRQAFSDARRWPGLKMAINVSPVQLRGTDFVESAQRLLNEFQLEASRIELVR